ncbi:MAG: DUF6516 family protein [Thermodesulfobacteriota bacterium]|nr:DUF6516 family protein [Thermodesulfobacteriota bacterium]
MLNNMGARLLLSDNIFVEIIVWQLSSPLARSRHRFKYRLALVVNGTCVMRYDNEAGKGDHKHISGHERPYQFTTPEALLNDFWNDVNNWRV